MMDPATAYFLKKYYPHVIKWWLVVYNPEVIRIWPSKEERNEALRLEAKNNSQPALEDFNNISNNINSNEYIDDSAYNATTGSYSGLYGQKPIDDDTKSALDAIMNISSNQSNIDYLFNSKYDDVIIPPEQEDIINEANAIYERLLREAAEDEAKKQLEIEKAKQEYETV